MSTFVVIDPMCVCEFNTILYFFSILLLYSNMSTFVAIGPIEAMLLYKIGLLPAFLTNTNVSTVVILFCSPQSFGIIGSINLEI